MTIEVTVRKLRNHQNLDGSRFLELYEMMLLQQEITADEHQELLTFAVLFLRQGDEVVARLGYRILLQYSLDTLDFDPLIAIADQWEIMPILSAIRRSRPDAFDDEALGMVISAAHSANFSKDGVTRTREQLALQQFNKQHAEAVIVAPTSYGKSEMLITRAIASLPAAVCIVVPSKALIAQTKNDLVKVMKDIGRSGRVITHPEAYNGERSFIAILTQERLHRLYVDNPELRIDHLLIDEAQNILSDDARSLELSQVILIARSRNQDLQIAYYTPFLEEPDAIQHVNATDQAVRARTVSEVVKVERFYAGEVGGRLHIYDQYLDRGFSSEFDIPSDEAEAVLALAGKRTIVYLNRPRDAQSLALRIAAVTGSSELSELAETAISAITDLIDKDYVLIEAIRNGVLFHHGQIPEVLRQYVERLFREDDSQDGRYLVTTSTLLEGVNTPADTMILMSAGKGRSNLTRSSFRNLVGRVARFSQIFAAEPNLNLLLPRIYAIKGGYSRVDWNPLKWMADRADPSKPATDPVDNPLLERGPTEQPRIEALERLENIERGSSGLEEPRLALTEVGQLCFRHGAHDFDVFRYERLIQERVDSYRGTVVADADELLSLISNIFLRGVELIGKDTGDLTRLHEEDAARNFYAMFMSWRADGSPMKMMIGRYLKYWADQSNDLIWVGSKWGDVKRFPNEHGESYIRRSMKSRPALVNLAIVRIKAELDFLDYNLMKYVEILFTLEILDESFYLRLKYGTDNRAIITLLRNGLTFELAKLVNESYSDYVEINASANTIELQPTIMDAMEAGGVNDILLFEIRGLLGAQG